MLQPSIQQPTSQATTGISCWCNCVHVGKSFLQLTMMVSQSACWHAWRCSLLLLLLAAGVLTHAQNAGGAPSDTTSIASVSSHSSDSIAIRIECQLGSSGIVECLECQFLVCVLGDIDWPGGNWQVEVLSCSLCLLLLLHWTYIINRLYLCSAVNCHVPFLRSLGWQ